MISANVICMWWWLIPLGVALDYATEIKAKHRRMKGARCPPGPIGLPLVGNALDLVFANSNTMPVILAKWARQYGPVAQFRVMGTPQVIISDERIANDLFVKRGNIYSDRGAPHAVEHISMNQNPGFRPKDSGWRRQRNLMHSAVSMTNIEKYQSLMDFEATLTLEALLQSPWSFDDHFLRYAYSVLTSSLLGFTVRSASDPYIHWNEQFTAKIMDSFRPDCFPSNVFPWLKHLPAWLVPSLAKMESLRKEYVGQMWDFRKKIEKSVEDGSATESIYKHFLLNRRDYAVTEEESVHTFQSMIDGGTRSPHNNLLTFLFLMMEYPEWQKRLHDEIDQVSGMTRMPSYKDIPNLPTVRAIVKETVRYRNIVAEMGISHALDKDDIYGDYFFEKGTVFHATFASILMDKKTYPDGKLFNPARWLDSSYPTYKEPLSVYPNCQGFAAFGYGRRACPGVEFAERSLIILVAKLGWGVRIQWPRDEQGNDIREALAYEPVPAPRPMKFRCNIVARDEGRATTVLDTAADLGGDHH